MVVARVSHFDPRCPVCSVGTPGIFTTGAVVPPPYPNPEYKRRLRNGETSQGGQHGHLWYHGTHFSPEEDDEGEHDPVVQEAGGRLRTPEWSGEPGSRADEHWNTDLGVHFTSLHHVAKDLFAKPQNGDIDSRVAHATLHMQNPKHFDSEHDMTHEAIDWAQKNGLHYLPKHHRAHEEFENGHYAGVADHDPSGTWDEVHPPSMPPMREQREAISHIDRHGPSWEKGDPDEGDKEKYLATHPRRATLTEGYRQHLQSQGHDGIVYGNEHEGPEGHASAIAFPETPVAIHKWEWFHPEHTRPADAQESAEKMRTAPSNRQLKLFGSGGNQGPQTAAVYRVHHAQGISGMHPVLAQSPGETPQKAGETLKGMLHHLGHPDADYAFVIRHPKPEKGISSPVYSEGDPGVALHPQQWTNEYLAHEAAHLMQNHSSAREPGTPLDDEANHGVGFQGHLRSVLNYLSPETKDFPGAGDDFLEHVRYHMGKTAASYTYNQTVMGPEGYEDRVNTVEGPLYHGGRANLAPGEHLTIGRKPNEWGDDGGKSTHNYFTRNRDTALSYAQQVGRRGRVYEVEPTGDFKMDHSEDDFKTQHPVRVVREVPREEWPDWAKKASKTAASDWSFEHYNIEGGKHWRSFGGPAESPRQHMLEYQKTPEGQIDFGRSMLNERSEQKDPEAHARMRQNALEHHNTIEHDPAAQPPPEPPKQQRRVYYHGTTVPDVTHVLPATHHGQGVVFHNVTSPEHAYATTSASDAWDYAQKAFDFKMNGRPRVYQVRPIGGHKNVEKDPSHDQYGQSRGNNESDFRSKHGFEVVREMKPPKHVRDSYTDEEWGDD